MVINRRTNTDIHVKVRLLLDALGLIYEEEKIFPPYRLDFWLPECKLGVEADSDYWHSERKDRARDEFLLGTYRLKVIRCGYNITRELLLEMIEKC